MSAIKVQHALVAEGGSKPRRSLTDLLAPLDKLCVNSSSLIANRGARFESGGESYELPRYLFIGPQGGDLPIRLGLFASINGDEPEGAYALVELAKLLEARPSLANGYCLSLYPVCNPTGFEDDTRRSRRGAELNQLFWSGSNEPEIRLLQAELGTRSFHGIISLHTDPATDSFYGVVRGPTLARQLLVPALQAAEMLLPSSSIPAISRFEAHEEGIHNRHRGGLSAAPKVRPRPFEILLATPKAPPSYIKQLAIVAALRTILAEYRRFISYAHNI